jgi:alpha-tubulin suppressor-like RCC1 family protein
MDIEKDAKLNPEIWCDEINDVKSGSLVNWGSIVLGNDIKKITAGSHHCLGIKKDGSLIAWGNNKDGQCDVPDGNNFIAIYAGSDFSMALRANGSLIAWGSNEQGQCNIPEGNNFVAINYCTAVKSDGTLVSWRGNCNEHFVKHLVNDIIAISECFALKSDGSIISVGCGGCIPPVGREFIYITNNLALKSDGTIINLTCLWLEKASLPIIGSVKAIASNGDLRIALHSDGSISAWRYHDSVIIDVPQGNDFVDISIGADYGVALRSNGTVIAWGIKELHTSCIKSPSKEQQYQLIDSPRFMCFSSVALGYNHCVAIKFDGSLLAWGNNEYGQCNVPDGDDYIAVAVGEYVSFALKSDGSLKAWGNNTNSQCNVPKGNDYVAIASGGCYSFALKTDGSIEAWGDDIPSLPENGDFIAISAGELHYMGLKSDGSIKTWGYSNEYGQGNHPKEKGFISIAAGTNHCIALKSDGTLTGWGRNDKGQCNVPIGNDYIAIAAGESHSLALKSDGTIEAWGDNMLSQCNIPKYYYKLYNDSKAIAIYAGYDLSAAIVQLEFWDDPDCCKYEQDYNDIYVPLCDAFDRDDLDDELQEEWDNDYEMYYNNVNYKENYIDDENKDCVENDIVSSKNCSEDNTEIYSYVRVYTHSLNTRNHSTSVLLPGKYDINIQSIPNPILIQSRKTLESYGFAIGLESNERSLYILGSDMFSSEEMLLIANTLPTSVTVSKAKVRIIFPNPHLLKDELLTQFHDNALKGIAIIKNELDAPD